MKFFERDYYPPFYLRSLSYLFQIIVQCRRWFYRKGYKKVEQLPIPVIVVGNITVGGTGKTPLVIALAQFLKKQGFQPGIVSRGYGGKAKRYPQVVDLNSDPLIVGDEAILLAKHSGCPTIVDPDRVSAARAVMKRYACNVIIADDGLQHYALGRSIEIAVLDGDRRLGNGFCLPAGPLRELPERLHEVDFVMTNGSPEQGEYGMQFISADLIHLTEPQLTKSLSSLKGQTVHAVAGIGHPQRFFRLLREFGLIVIEHPFPDHHRFKPNDIVFGNDALVIMTEKDAVKCERFSVKNCWYLPITCELSKAFFEALMGKLESK